MRLLASSFISSASRIASGALVTAVIASGCQPKDERLPSQPAESQPEASTLPTTVTSPLAVLPPAPATDPKKVALGGQLYFDGRLSGDGTITCATCHGLDTGGTDSPLKTSAGIRSQMGPINSPTVFNAHFNLAQFWDGRAATLEEQAAGPVENPLEMGATWPDVLARLQAVPAYVAAFQEAYGAEITKENATHAIAEYERTLITPSRFDRFGAGDVKALTDEEREGMQIFMRSGCTSCHAGPLLGGQSYQKMGAVRDYFAARGGELTDADLGRFNFTKVPADKHKFKVPTLRNVALTPPYFHDGHAKTLEEAVKMMATYQLGTTLSSAETAKIVAFLKALTGENLPTAPALAPPPVVVQADIVPSPDDVAPTADDAAPADAPAPAEVAPSETAP